MNPRKLVITQDGITIEKGELHYGFFDYIKPSKLWLKFFLRSDNDRTDLSKDIGKTDFEEIRFSEIKSIKLEKLRMGDKYILLELKNERKIKFFAVDEFNTKDPETQEIFYLISIKLTEPNY